MAPYILSGVVQVSTSPNANTNAFNLIAAVKKFSLKKSLNVFSNQF